MYFSENLKELLAKRRMKAVDLAKALNISPQQAGRYLNGSNQPKMETLIKLAELFDIAIDDLVLMDLSKEQPRKFGEGVADEGPDVDAQTRELNKLLRQRVAQVEAALKRENPELARELGIE